MKKFHLITMIAIFAITLLRMPSAAKVNVTLNEYKLAEATASGVNIRTGAGTNFPKAYTVYKDWDGRKAKTEVGQTWKGQRFFVKDAGDWWEIDTPGKVDGDSPRFILKKYAGLVETDPIDVDSITEPQVWGYAETIQYGDDEDGYEDQQVTIVTIYPGGVAITQYYSCEGDAIGIGEVLKDKSAVIDRMVPGVGITGDPVPGDAPLKIWADAQLAPPTLMWQYGEKTKSSFTHNGLKVDYIDITAIPAAQWIDLAKTLAKSEHRDYIRRYRSDPDTYRTLTDLSKFTRIK